LIDAGADPFLADMQGKTPYEHIISGYDECARNTMITEVLPLMLRVRNLSSVHVINRTIRVMAPLLHHKEYAVVELMLTAGANPMLPVPTRKSALSLIYSSCDDDTTARLFNCANVQPEAFSQFVPRSISERKIKVLQVIVNAGTFLRDNPCSPSAVFQALYTASVQPNIEFLQILLQCPRVEKLLDHTDENRRTLLHRAAEADNVEAFQLLLDAGADPTLVDANGVTVLMGTSEDICELVIDDILHFDYEADEAYKRKDDDENSQLDAIRMGD
jgi:hypothetical protein